MFGLGAPATIAILTSLFVGVALALALLVAWHHGRRRRRLSAILSPEGWETAPTESGWGWKPDSLRHSQTSRISIKPRSNLAEIRLTVDGICPDGLCWLVVSQEMLGSADRSWLKGLPAQSRDLVRSSTPLPLPQLPGYVLLTRENVWPPSEVLGTLQELREIGVDWVVWACSSTASVRRLGPSPDDAWPALKAVSQVLLSAH